MDKICQNGQSQPSYSEREPQSSLQMVAILFSAMKLRLAIENGRTPGSLCWQSYIFKVLKSVLIFNCRLCEMFWFCRCVTFRALPSRNLSIHDPSRYTFFACSNKQAAYHQAKGWVQLTENQFTNRNQNNNIPQDTA